MLTKEQAKPGATVIYIGKADEEKETTVLTGGYEDPELGFMVKTSLYPGCMPLSKFKPVVLAEEITEVEVLPAVSFELQIVDEKEPLRLTAALIKAKSKPLTDLTIANMFDEAGYDAVKKAKNRAVKTRTSIEKKEEEVLKQIKTRHKAEIKEVTDYTAELYTACKEVENDLLGKMEKVDNERAAAKAKADADLKAKTEGRENKMYELGLTWNGKMITGYGRIFEKSWLFELTDVQYEALVTELEGLQMEHGVTGKESEPIVEYADPVTTSRLFNQSTNSQPIKKAYISAIFDETVDGVRFVITDGRISDPEVTAKIINKQILNSKYFVQAIGK